MQTHVGPPILCDATQSPCLFAAPVLQLPYSLSISNLHRAPPVTSLLLVESSSQGFPQVNTRIDYALQGDDWKKLGCPEKPAVLTVLF